MLIRKAWFKGSVEVALFLSLFVAALPVLAMEVKQLTRLINRLCRGKTSRVTMTMTIKTQLYERSINIKLTPYRSFILNTNSCFSS